MRERERERDIKRDIERERERERLFGALSLRVSSQGRKYDRSKRGG